MIDFAENQVFSHEDMEGTVFLINSSRFGQGNPRLGEALMKSFFESVLEGSMYPSTILFSNTGISLVCQDSPILDSLQKLEAGGVHILACEQSLDFYLMSAQQVIGQPISMKEQIQIFMLAKKVITL